MKTTTHFEHSFKTVLQEELVERCRKNSSYSLRSFAKFLSVSPAALSDMLNGKRTITNKSIEKFGLALGLGLKEIEGYQKNKLRNLETPVNNNPYRQVTLDQFAIISDWYHYAMIELLKVPGFSKDILKISRALGITKMEAQLAVERLLRLELLEYDEEGELRDTSSGFSTNISESLTSQGSRKLQKQILEQSLYALENISIDQRNHTSMTMAIDPALLPEAIKRLAAFRRELCAFLESQGNPKEVYQLSLSLFPVTQISKENI